VALLIVLFLCPGAAYAEEPLLPQALWQQVQDFLAQAPLSLQQFAADPVGWLITLLQETLLSAFRAELHCYSRLVLFVLLAGVLALYTPGLKLSSMLELIAAAGIFLLAFEPLMALTETFMQSITGWRSYLISFIPVFSGVLTATGQPASAAVYGGFFLTCVNGLAQLLLGGVRPALAIFLAASGAAAISENDQAQNAARLVGSAIRKLINLAAVGFCGVMGMQRLFTAAADSTALQAGQLLSSTVPVVGQTLSAAAQSLLAAGSALRTGLGFSAILVIGLEFLPLYLRCLAHLFCLFAAALLAGLFELGSCKNLLNSLSQAAAVLGALAALFFWMVLSATALMFDFGKGI